MFFKELIEFFKAKKRNDFFIKNKFEQSFNELSNELKTTINKHEKALDEKIIKYTGYVPEDLHTNFESISVCNPVNNQLLLKVDWLSEEIDEIDIHGSKLDSQNALEKVNMFVQQLPLLGSMSNAIKANASINALSKQLEGAFQIIIPEGATGELMKYKNGLLGTPLVTGNRIGSTHAGLKAIDKVPVKNINITPLAVFSIMSMVTGQYFMRRIDKTLTSLNQNVKTIIDMILDEKEALNYSAYTFLNFINMNFNDIVENDGLRISTLTNIQMKSNDLMANVYFYDKTITRKLRNMRSSVENGSSTSERIACIYNKANEILECLRQRQASTQLFFAFKIYEIRISQIYSEMYFNNVKDELNNFMEQTKEEFKKIQNEFSKCINTTWDKAWFGLDEIITLRKEINEHLPEETKKYQGISNEIIRAVDQMFNFSYKEKKLILQDNNLYLIAL